MARIKGIKNKSGFLKKKYQKVIESDSNLAVKPKFLTDDFIKRYSIN